MFHAVDVFHNAFVQQCLADITAPAGNAADTQCAHQIAEAQSRFLPSKTTDVIQIQLMGILINYRRYQKQDQLEHGVIHHVQEAAPCSQRIMLAQQTKHTHTHQNEADLGYGGAGQRTLEIHRE